MAKPSRNKSRKAAVQKKQQHVLHPENNGCVDEATRIRIVQLLRRFRWSLEQAYSFEPNMGPYQRALVHQESRKLGLGSKSSGKGHERRVSVFKRQKKSDGLGKTSSAMTFSEESKSVLRDLFIHYPPGEDEVGNLIFKDHTLVSGGRKDDTFYKPIMKKGQIAERVEKLRNKIKKTPKLGQISEMRSKLPIASFQDVITSTIANHQVVLIAGETGCGKTTQVPQYLLDYMWACGQACKIVCTQPRRISAMSVAERIAHERGEVIGDSVGYKIRLEAKGGRHSSIIFCTNGVMLRKLVSGGSNGSQSRASDISQITHIIVDEVHERDRYSDFMLAILRELLPTYPHLRLVLMSATLDAERFSQYFGGSPIIRVPGFTHPVKSFYLEEILSILKTPGKNHLNAASFCHLDEGGSLSGETCVALDEAIELAISNTEVDLLLKQIVSQGPSKVLNYQHSSTGTTPLMVVAGKGRVSDIFTLLSLGADCHLKAHDGSTALDWAKREKQSEAEKIIRKHMGDNDSSPAEVQKLIDKYMSKINPDYIDVVLIEQLLKKICMESKDGAILIFLPGWEDINKTREKLLDNPFFNNPSKFLILSLHSMVPSADQKKVFKRPPLGCRKIIISTNIAETAITIDDVVYVLDSGRIKEKSYDPYNKVSTLQSSWISKASAKQREGRAGRCQPGVCYHLYSKLRAVSMPEFHVPEIRRIPIEELCLQVKMLDSNCKIEKFLNKTLDPPVFETIKNAITVLQEIGALSLDEQLTELGEKLGSLPLHPLISRMLFLAILLNCLDPALTLACAADYRNPFTLPMFPEEKRKAAKAKAELASLYGGCSDQLAVVAAFDCWKSAKENGQESRFCSQYFVSSNTMFMLSGMRRQLQNELVRTGCIPDDVSSCSMNAREPGIIRAVLLAGLYPKVGRLHPPRPNKGKRPLVEVANGDKVGLHASSMNSKLSIKQTDDPPLLVYDEITRGDDGCLYTRNCTLIGPLPLLLLATEIVVAPAQNTGVGEENSDEGEIEGLDKTHKLGEKAMSSPENDVTVIVDRWLSYELKALEVAQIYCLRERLSAAILFKVTHPRDVLPPAMGTSIYAIACALAYDGMTGISVLDESVDTLTSMVSNADIGNSSAGKKMESPSPSIYLMHLFNHSTHKKVMSFQSAHARGSSKRPRGNRF